MRRERVGWLREGSERGWGGYGRWKVRKVVQRGDLKGARTRARAIEESMEGCDRTETNGGGG